MITISNIRENPEGEYVGRANKTFGVNTSPLANPFPLTKESEREEVISKYGIWLEQQRHSVPVRPELERLKKIYLETGNLNLVCWCYPKRCHAEIIREILLEEIKNGQVGKTLER